MKRPEGILINIFEEYAARRKMDISQIGSGLCLTVKSLPNIWMGIRPLPERRSDFELLIYDPLKGGFDGFKKDHRGILFRAVTGENVRESGINFSFPHEPLASAEVRNEGWAALCKDIVRRIGEISEE
jgi:hypothetical protein